MGKVGAAVQRVNIPAKLSVHPLPRPLLAIDAVAGKSLAQPLLDQLFGRPVGYRNQIYVAFVLGFDARSKELAQPRAGFLGNGRGFGNPYKLRC